MSASGIRPCAEVMTGMDSKLPRYQNWCRCGNKRNHRRWRWGVKRWANRYRRRNIDRDIILEQME